MKKLEIHHNDETTRLDQAIAKSKEAQENNLSRSLIRKLIIAGAVYLNRRRVRIASKPVLKNSRIELYVNESTLHQKEASTNAENFLPLKILYQDEAIVCLDKPAGLPTQPTLDEARINLFALAKKEFPKYLGLHHRLDKDTSGVMLFTLDKKHNDFIGKQFKEHLCKKIYIAVVHGKIEKPEYKIESFLDKVSKKGKAARYGSVKKGGKKAITEFTTIESNNKYSMIEVSIQTGRTHQIRVHLSELGHPIVGDFLYGSNEKISRHLLHAKTLTIAHPVTKNLIQIESPVPPRFREFFK